MLAQNQFPTVRRISNIMIFSRRQSIERQSVERAELKDVATLHAPRKNSEGPKLLLHDP